MSTQVLSKKTVFKSDLLKLKEWNILLSNNTKRTHYVAERVPTVCVFPLTDNYELYLINQYRYLFGRSILEAVSGHVEAGEKPLETAKRELVEEAGITGKVWKKLASLELSSSVIDSTCHLFSVKDIRVGKAKPMIDEEIETVKIPLDKAVEKVIDGEISHVSTANGIMLLYILKRQNKI